MKMYAWLSGSNFVFLWSSVFGTYICELDVADLLRATLFFLPPRFITMKSLVVSVMFQTSFCYTASVCINICLCHDLMKCLHDPMRNPEGRYPLYGVFVLVMSLTIGLVRSYSWYENIYGYLIQFIFICYLVIAICSIYYAVRFVSKPGISEEARKLIVRIHISYIVVNVICQMYSIVSKVIVPFGKKDDFGNLDTNFNKWYWHMLAVFFFGQGLWLSLIRILEPKYAETVWYNLKIRFCCGAIEKKI